MSGYPIVRDEIETLRRVCAGASIARYGDGEFKICRGGDAVAQRWTTGIQQRLRAILHESGACMVGIPNLNTDALDQMTDQKREFWQKHTVFSDLLVGRPYASAFITRPDSAPRINTPEYWQQVESLWLGQDVTLVRGSSKGLTCDDLVGAGQIREIVGPRQHAFEEYDALMARIGTPKRALLCLGPTATVMAVDLCAKGVHAIDLGHIALFVRKYRRGEPMTLSKDDKSQDKVRA
jgi:hypothetical protein